MKTIMNVRTHQERAAARMAGELRARTVFVQLICIVSILRTVLTRILPLAGSGAWWLTLLCLLPGLVLFLLLSLGMRLTRTTTLTGLVRRCLGQTGGWAVSMLLTIFMLYDGTASMTALITMFTEGVGTSGTQLTLAILTGGVLLTCLHREGLPRGVYLLRFVMLGAALITGLFTVHTVRTDSLFPMLGDGRPALASAFHSGVSISWPVVLLLTVPKEKKAPYVSAVCPVVLAVLCVVVFITLTVPHELLTAHHGLADSLLLPARYAPSALRMLMQCLLMLVLFLGIGGASQLSTEFLCAPMGQFPGWLPYAVLILLTGTQALDTVGLWEVLALLEPWLLLPIAILAAACLPIAVFRRERG